MRLLKALALSLLFVVFVPLLGWLLLPLAVAPDHWFSEDPR